MRAANSRPYRGLDAEGGLGLVASLQLYRKMRQAPTTHVIVAKRTCTITRKGAQKLGWTDTSPKL